MPRYLYRNDAGEERWEERAVENRDAAPPGFKRANPVEFAPAVCPKGPPSQAEEVLRGFKEVEQRLGTTETVRQTGYHHKVVKRAWERPTPNKIVT